MNRYLKIFCTTGLISMMAISIAYGASANKSLTIDNKTQKLPIAPVFMNGTSYKGSGDIPPIIYRSRIYMALGDFKSLLGAKVQWNAKTESAVITKDHISITMKKNSSTYRVNGVTKTMEKDMAMKIANNRSVAPLSVIARELGFVVSYDAKSGRATLAYEQSDVSNNSLFSPGELSVKNENTENIVNQEGTTIFQNGEGVTAPAGEKNTPAQTSASDLAVSSPGPMPVKEESKDAGQTASISGTSSPENAENLAPTGPPGSILYSWNYNQDNTESYDISTGSNSSYSVNKGSDKIEIVVKNAAMDTNLLTSEQYPASNFIEKMESSFSDNMTTMTLLLKSGVNSNAIQFKEGTRSVVIQYGHGKVEVNKGYIYNSDRVNSSITFKLSDSFRIDGTTLEKSPGILSFQIPKTSIQMTTGTEQPKDRNVSSIEVVDAGNAYEVKIGIKDRVFFSVIESGEGKSIKIGFKKTNNLQIRVAIDPGHGGKDPGATNRLNGLSEKDITLPIGTLVVQKLKNQGVDAYLTKEGDKFIELSSRAVQGNQKDADLFVSIHGNSSNGNSEAKGIETWYFPSSDNEELAKIIQDSMIQRTGAENRGTKKAKFVVLNLTQMPAALVEVGFISNMEESTRLADSSYQDLLADAIAQGIMSWIQSR